MQVLDLAIDLRTFTTAYRHVLNPAIPKKADSDQPLEQCVLSVFSALYRVEMGAWYRILAPWFHSNLHPAIHGGVSNHEALEVSWEAQADIEDALLRDVDLLFAAVDYFKYFDSFVHQWVHGFIRRIGFPTALADMVLIMYLAIQRYIKLAKAYGLAQQVFNGMGQGDHAALFPAIAFVSGQLFMIDILYPSVRKGACIDDRNFRGNYEDVMGTYHVIYDFDIAAGHMLQASKNVMMATTQESRDALRKVVLHGHKVSCPTTLFSPATLCPRTCVSTRSQSTKGYLPPLALQPRSAGRQSGGSPRSRL